MPAGVGLADVILSFHSILRSDVSSGASIESRYSASNIYTLVRGVGDNAAAVRASPVGRLSRFFVLGFPRSTERSALGWMASATRLRAAYQMGFRIMSRASATAPSAAGKKHTLLKS